MRCIADFSDPSRVHRTQLCRTIRSQLQACAFPRLYRTSRALLDVSGTDAGLHDLAATDLAQATSRHSDIADAVVVFEGDASLEHAGRQLTVFTASSLLTNVGNRLVNAFLSAGVGTFVGGIAGGGAVPADLAALIDSAIREINAAVAQSITEVWPQKQAQCRGTAVSTADRYRY